MNAAARHDYWLLAEISACISIGALIFYYHQGAILLYGDAVAHINIARRVFDSRTPGLVQLGTVWLPLPHILDIPFIVNDRLWQTGLGGSIPSVLAYIAGTLGVFRLVRGMASRTAAWTAALAYALNPNLIYMQATAMTEPLYLAFFIWSAVYFTEFVGAAAQKPDQARKSLEKCALMVSGAMLVRYDGWFLAAVIAVASLIMLLRRRFFAGPMRHGFINFLLLTGATAGLFLAYNHAAYGNALEFANGPYSPRAIQERSKTPTMPSYPGEKSPRAATLQFLKISRLNLAEGKTEYILFTAAFIALLAAIYFARKFLPWTVLWAPLPFYVLCIAWGSVPIYQPEWWPFSYYNVRYGLQLLPAIAVFFALSCEFAANFFPRRAVTAATFVLIAASYVSVWNKTPICLREAEVNGRDRLQLEMALAQELHKLPASATFMMDCGPHPGAFQLAGIPFRRVIRESNHPEWTVGLAHPAQAADYLIAFPGDDVSRAVRLFPEGLQAIATIGTPTQPGAIIYRALR
ncbi:MAG TPA: glycosyltransferase family 39 protein [Candidatus Angelobacter sp.]|nr:glycosyltransferase family 39 protein [Candidatus Angelobacter sp.]